MSTKNESSSTEPNYSLALQLGYELSEKDFIEVYNYAKLVKQEYKKIPSSPTPVLVRSSRPSLSSTNLSRIVNDGSHFEDLWIKHLRECFDSANSG